MVIEKHFTMDKSDRSIDSFFSLEPREFKSLVNECNAAYKSLGKVYFGPTKLKKNH